MNEEQRIDLLKHMELIQRQAAENRDEREFRIFSWTSNILLLLIGALLIAKPSEYVVWWEYGIWGRLVASIAVAFLVVFSMQWQNRNRKWRQENGRAIQRIDRLLHYYDSEYFDPAGEISVLPKEWETEYLDKDLRIVRRLASTTYPSATAILGLLAVVMIWVS